MYDTGSSLHGANLSIAAFLKQPAQWKSGVHATLRLDNVVAQTCETIANIEATAAHSSASLFGGRDR